MKKIDNSVKIAEPYFCPYCRTLFIQGYNEPKKSEVKFTAYICQENQCMKPFSEHDYKSEAKNGQNYKFPNKYIKNMKDDNAQIYISSLIINLWKDGYTNRDIHIITRFSRTRIQKTIQEKKRSNKSMTQENFCRDYLKIEKDDYYKILERK